MDLYNHPDPPFTRWVIENRLLKQSFVVIDIGCQGGEHPRWRFLGDRLDFHGFDPLREVVAELNRQHRPGRTYYELALGNEDGERDFFVPANTFSASFYPAGDTATKGETRKVPIRRLDTLFASGAIPVADYIKLDCEGFEPEILRGSRQYLAASGPICLTTETNFGVSPTLPHTHYQAINEIAVEHRLLVFDLNLVRASRPSFCNALAAHPFPFPDPFTETPELDVGAPSTVDVLFCRDFVAEDVDPVRYVFSPAQEASPSVDKLIKAMINFELHGLADCAYEIAEHFHHCLQERLDVRKACELLLVRPPVARNTKDVANCLGMIRELRTRLGSRTEYADWGCTQQILAGSLNEAKRSQGAAVMGLGYTTTEECKQLKMHLVITGCATELNEFVAAIFREGSHNAVAVASRPAFPGKQTTIAKTFTIPADAPGRNEFEVRVGLAQPGGMLFLNGDAQGPDSNWPLSFLEIKPG